MFLPFAYALISHLSSISGRDKKIDLELPLASQGLGVDHINS